ncbi:MAG TPA: Asp-tRNA(Asn)/Glu-tRNA(Gln) amidotransferase subunit GatB [Chitinophagaceae bacterium]|jgi:aspartyl-tRNA(Asn)/glutamyl-tRNA(Gln) amidotransferase subunit B|nr:Asp-tRNA(Asn)/Glu-tRNA(Gln) amidotransferase subunit GatB [Chitinophagaceae bacterium]
MAINYDAYEVVVGLEVHVQLLTQSKLFCGDSAAFGSEPNTQVSPITLAHPGALPKMNKKAIEFAVKVGLACHSEIERENYFARKNYFYPDLPKGYQLSQHTTPICKGGYITIKTKEDEKNIRLNRIHLEEDAGKSLHDIYPNDTAIDLNRAGVALIEIVTEPDIRSGEEAYAYLTELRKLVRYLEISDGNMEEGSLRCDANISVRKKGEVKLGTKAEVKNLNSIRNVKRAIEFEGSRMIEMVEQGLEITQQTRSFDATSGTSFAIRDKEDADDYRYFPDPDLTKFILTEEFVETVRQTIPVLQPERIKKYSSQFQLSYYDSSLLTEEKKFSDYFEKIIKTLDSSSFSSGGEGPGMRKAAANWMLGPIKSWLNDNHAEIDQFPLAAEKIAAVIQMIEQGKLSFSSASTKLFSELLKNPKQEPNKIVEEKNWLQDSNVDSIENLIDQVLNKFPEKVQEYRKGKKGLMGLFVGEVMKLSKGKADPKITNDILSEKLKS